MTSYIKRLLLVIAFFPVALSSQSVWTKTDGTLSRVNEVLQSSNGHLIARTPAGIFVSTDDGGSWDARNAGLPGSPLGFGITSKGTILCSPFYKGIWRSTDDGISWSQTYSQSITIISFAENKEGLILGSSPQGIFRSSNDGVTWEKISSQSVNYIAVNPKGTFFISGVGSAIYFSTDNGNTWNDPGNNGLATPFQYVERISIGPNGQLFLTGVTGIFRSTNDGKDWTPINFGLQDFNIKSSIIFNGLNRAFCVSMGSIYQSSNGGNVWTQTAYGLSGEVQAISVLPNNVMLAFTVYGVIYRRGDFSNTAPLPPTHVSPQSNTAGLPINLTLRWNKPSNSQISRVQITTFSDFSSIGKDTTVLFADELTVTGLSHLTRYYWRVSCLNEEGTSGWSWEGNFLTTPPPTAWRTLNIGTTEKILNAAMFSKTTAICVGEKGTILRTVDGGSTWAVVYQGDNRPPQFNKVKVLNDTAGIIITEYEALVTFDAGSSWKLIPVIGIIDFAIITPSVFATLQSYAGFQRISISTDAGLSWRQKQAQNDQYSGLVELRNTNGMLVAVKELYTLNWGVNFLISNDHGDTWNEISANLNIRAPRNLSITNSGTMYLSCNANRNPFDGYLYRSTTGGKTWQQLISYINSETPQHRLFNDSLILSFRLNTLSMLDVPNNTWQKLPNTPVEIAALFFYDRNNAMMVGTNGLLYSTTTGGVLSVANAGPRRTPEDFTLEQNYPNPFNPATVIQCSLPVSGETTLIIYDALGREIVTLFSGNLGSGVHSFLWNGLRKDDQPAVSGIYFYCLRTGGHSLTKKMILLK